MKHAVKHIHFIGVVGPSRKQGSRLRNANGREERQMPMWVARDGEVVR